MAPFLLTTVFLSWIFGYLGAASAERMLVDLAKGDPSP
jgi:hypothetical protein